MTLVARRRKHFRVFLAIFLVAQLSSKRGVLVHKNSLASCLRCRHSVEPRALTCPFKHSDLVARSLLNWHLTHKFIWGRINQLIKLWPAYSTFVFPTARQPMAQPQLHHCCHSDIIRLSALVRDPSNLSMICNQCFWQPWKSSSTKSYFHHFCVVGCCCLYYFIRSLK